MYATASRDGAPPPGFGVRLTAANVEAHLASLREGRDAYIASHPQEAAEVAASVAKAASRPMCREMAKK
jgi:hypothetical protein